MIQEALELREVLNLFFGYYACSEIVNSKKERTILFPSLLV